MANESLLAALGRMGLIKPGEKPDVKPVPASGPSELARVDLTRETLMIECPLPAGNAAAPDQGAVSNVALAWMKAAGRIAPKAVPAIVAEDAQSGAFAMQYFDPAAFPKWDTQLREGTIEAGTAGEIARIVAAMHGATAGLEDVEQAFRSEHVFVAYCLDPYLRAGALTSPDSAARLETLAQSTLTTRKTLIHGAFIPGNILSGPHGPVFLGGHCAWFGDPAFDLSCCLNHLLLNCVARPQWIRNYLACYDAIVETYMGMVTWENVSDMEQRTAHLVPGLLLGPAHNDYAGTDTQRARIQAAASKLLLRPVSQLAALRETWMQAIGH